MEIYTVCELRSANDPEIFFYFRVFISFCLHYE